MEARPIVELSRLIKTPVVPFLSILLAAAPLQHASGQAAADNAALTAAFAQGLDAYRKTDYQKAVEQFGIIFANTKEKTPESVLYCLGFAHYNLRQYGEAVKVFRQYVEHFPQDEKTPEVQLFLGKSLLESEDESTATANAEEALKFIAQAAKNPDLLEAARFAAADAYIKKKDTEKAAGVLETAIKEKISGPMLMKVSLQLVDLYIDNDKLTEAGALLRKIEDSASYADVIVAVNHRLVQLGDKHLEAQHYPEALECYSGARPKVQVIALQKARLDYMRSRLASLTKFLQAQATANKPVPHRFEEQATILKAMIENVDATLTQVNGMEQYDAILEYRIARCYFNMKRYWPATAAFEAVISDFPTFGDAPTALYGATLSQWTLNRKDAARALATRYLDQNPTGKYVSQLAEINGVALLQQNMNEEAITFLSTYLASNPKTDNAESFRALLANARFAAGKFDTAADDYDKLRTDFPDSKTFEEYTYRRALCDFLRNRYDDTIKSFEAYEKAFPKGQFLTEVAYRRGIILLAKAAQSDDATKKAAYYKELLSSLDTVVKDPAADGLNLLGPVYTLMGDAYSAMGDKDSTTQAATSYAMAVKYAKGDMSVISYALDEATKMLRSARRYDDLTDLWQNFLKNNPGHPMELRGVGELSKLLVRAGKIDEARKLLVDHILEKVDNPRSEYVEMLLSQLADLYVPKRVVVKKGETPPPVSTVNPEDEMVKALDIAQDQQTPAYVARVYFARSELARKMKDAEKSKVYLKVLAGSAKPDDMSPVLLKIVGDYLFGTAAYDEAIPFYVRLRDAFPQSVYAEAAPVGLGRIAYEKKDYPGAIGFFDAALQNSSSSSQTLKEATFGKAQALYAQKKMPEAKALFEQIVGEKEWRGIEKAGALFYLGEIAASNGDPGDANGYYQRVYLSQGAFLDYVAKAYLRSSDMFQKKNDQDGYKNTLQAMAHNAKLASFPEMKEVQKRLQALGE